MNYYKRHLGDYAKKAGHLSPLEHGIYNLIIDAYYDRERAPKLEDAIIWARAKTKLEKKSVEAILNQFFDQNEDGSFSQNRIEEEIAAYRAKSAANSLIAQKREMSKRAHVVNDSCSDREHDVVFREPIHKPITNNQEPITKKKNTRAASAGVSRPAEISESVWADFLQIRENKRAKLTETALEGIRKESEKAGISLEEALRECCARGWAGFKAKWVERDNLGQSKPAWTKRYTDAMLPISEQDIADHEAEMERRRMALGGAA